MTKRTGFGTAASRILVAALLAAAMRPAAAEDWPEWRGKGRRGLWTETGVVESFPKPGLTVRWRTPVRAGYSGPAVAAGRVFLTDYEKTDGTRGTERAFALDEKTGAVLWARGWPVDYKGLSYGLGPRATPTVDGERVYTLGATGILHCLDTKSGAVVWQKDYRADYAAALPTWGFPSAPLVDGERLICVMGGQPDATVVALDKRTGRELWRAIRADAEPGYGPPILLEGTAVRQLVFWHSQALYGLDPATGRVLWQEPLKVNMGMTVATPVQSGSRLLVTSFYNGAMMMDVDLARAAARLVWKGKSSSEIDTDGLHSTISTPVIEGDYLYGICSYGQLRCLDARTGARLWESAAVTREKARWATAMFVRNGDRYFINNDRGELILARLSPSGYTEIDRTALIKPTSNPGNRRELGAVHWSHPAYANGHILVRNDEEILSASLRAN
jgi:outer membrane protein assembly factor BamB